jgi:hypothetical protein
MYSVFRFAILLSALALLPLVALAQAQGKVDVAKVRAKLVAGMYIEGKLTDIKEDEKKFNFVYTVHNKKPVPQGQAKLADITRQFNAALATRSTSLDQLKKLQEQGKAALKAAYDVEETPIVFELKGEKNLAIRTLIPPSGKSLTTAEIQKLKGDPRQPGLMAKIKDLDTKGFVRIYLDKSKFKATAKDNETTVYPITTIVIIPEPAQPGDPFVIPGS